MAKVILDGFLRFIVLPLIMIAIMISGLLMFLAFLDLDTVVGWFR